MQLKKKKSNQTSGIQVKGEIFCLAPVRFPVEKSHSKLGLKKDGF